MPFFLKHSREPAKSSLYRPLTAATSVEFNTFGISTKPFAANCARCSSGSQHPVVTQTAKSLDFVVTGAVNAGHTPSESFSPVIGAIRPASTDCGEHDGDHNVLGRTVLGCPQFNPLRTVPG